MYELLLFDKGYSVEHRWIFSRPLSKQPTPTSDIEKETVPLLQAILYEAYKQPLYHTEEYKKEIIAEFSKDVYLACIGD